MNIYVGNLPYSINEEGLKELFAPYGEVSSARIINDKFSGKSKGFGFVDMNDDSAAQEAIDALNGKEVDRRTIVVNQARESAPRPRNNGGGHRGGNGGGFRSRY